MMPELIGMSVGPIAERMVKAAMSISAWSVGGEPDTPSSTAVRGFESGR